MQSPIVLTGKPGPAVDHSALRQLSRLEHDLGADRAAIAARADEVEGDPVIRAVRIVAVEHRRLILIRDDHVHGATIGGVDQSHGSTVVVVGDADGLGDVGPACRTTIEVDARALVSGQAGVA